MIHEILLILSGSPDHTEENSNLFELQEFLHPSEKELLMRIMEIATNYHWIMAFCRNTQSCKTNETPEEPSTSGGGLYTHAFLNGIADVLTDYRNELVKLEDMFLRNSHLSLTYILSVLEKYLTLFHTLKSIIEKLQKDNVRGSLILGVLHRYIHSGIDIISEAAQKIIKAVNIVFYRHLCNWIIYGDIVDEHSEFFICDGKCPDENFLYPDQMEESVSATSIISIHFNKKHRIKRPPPVQKFFINWDLVPSFIPRETAECILFMGRIVWIIRNNPKKVSGEKFPVKVNKDVWEGEDMEYYKKLQILEKESFNPVKFQQSIEDCRIKLTKYLWSVTLEEGNLKQHLQLIRDYYAMGRGELFNQFITEVERHLQDSTVEHTCHNLNFIFSETARKIYGDHDKTYLRFELVASKTESPNLWSRVQLKFEINWPLHIIFHPKSMELYNRLFSYLLRLNRTQINLHKLWQQHMTGKQKINREVWTLRQHLIFLVNNLQYYLQVDVIEAQFSVLLSAVKNANEFEDIIKVHHEFISNLLAKTFVLTPDERQTRENKHMLHQTPAVNFNEPSKVYNVTVRLLDLCDEFCLVSSTWGPELTEPEFSELEKFQGRTDIIVEVLLLVLYNLHEKAHGQHLLQLLYQLDFNRFFTRSKPNFNLTT